VCRAVIEGSEVNPRELWVDVKDPVTVVWRLKDDDAFFESGDGPTFLTDGAKRRFSAGRRTKDPEGAEGMEPAKSKFYRITFDNSGSGPNDYSIKFHKNNQTFECDPTIVNSGG
jgi:hypothetical protein